MKYKIIEILKTFTETEIKQFNKFLQSPFFNESLKLRKLYAALLNFYPEFQSDILSEKYLSLEINPKLQFNKSTMKTLMFSLGNCAEEFLKFSNFSMRKADGEDLLREEFFKRRLFRLIDPNIKNTLSRIDSERENTTAHFYNKYKILTDQCNLFTINTKRSNKNFFTEFSRLYCERAKYFTYHFINEILYQYNTFLTIKGSFNIDEENNFVLKLFKEINFEHFQKFILSETDNEVYSVIFKLHLANYRAYIDPGSEKNYHDYKTLLIQNLSVLKEHDLYFHFIELIRYCMMRVNKGSSGFDFEKERFSIYKFILSKGYYKISVHTFIPIELYRTVLMLGLKLKKYPWTVNFIKEFVPKLNPEIRQNMHNYSLAEYYFHKKNFDNAMRYFHKIEMNHFMLKIDLKNLMLMTFYELGLYENALLLIDSYKHFISKSAVLSDDTKKKCSNFFMIVNNMILYKTSGKGSKKMIRKIDTGGMYHDTWVDEKLRALDRENVKSA